MTLHIPSVVRTAYDEYLDYIQSNPRVHIPEHFHDPLQSVGKIHASSLGKCPLAAAKSRETKSQHSLSTKHLMHQGVRDAEPIQEAMYWKFPIEVEAERSIERLPFRGRLDLSITADNLCYGIEIKRRDGVLKGLDGRVSVPTPYLTDVYQMIAYSYITPLEEVWLLLVTRFDLFFWQLKSTIGGFVLVDEENNEWRSEYNKPSYLNYDVILAEASSHQQYLNRERENDPFPDFLAQARGKQCFHWAGNERPKKYKTTYNGETERTANIVPHCQFFEQCKGITIPDNGLIPVREIEFNSKKYEVVT